MGVPPPFAVEKLHAAGIPIMNMVGHPSHVDKAPEAGVDLICAQGTEGGGHTGEIGTSVLVPMCVDRCAGKRSALTGGPVHVVAAGGIFAGRGLAAALAWGASAVWVGTRFVAAEEAGAPPRHQRGVVEADYADTIRTIIFTGRPLRIKKNDFVMDWEENRQDEIRELTGKGILPVAWQTEQEEKDGVELSFDEQMDRINPMLMGQAAGAIDSVKPAAEIMSEMMEGAILAMRQHMGNIVTVDSTATASASL